MATKTFEKLEELFASVLGEEPTAIVSPAPEQPSPDAAHEFEMPIMQPPLVSNELNQAVLGGLRRQLHYAHSKLTN